MKTTIEHTFHSNWTTTLKWNPTWTGNYSSIICTTFHQNNTFTIFSGVTAHRVTCSKRAVRKYFKKAATEYAQATIEWTWWSGETLLLLVRCTGGISVPSVARSNLPWKAATEVVTK